MVWGDRWLQTPSAYEVIAPIHWGWMSQLIERERRMKMLGPREVKRVYFGRTVKSAHWVTLSLNLKEISEGQSSNGDNIGKVL